GLKDLSLAMLSRQFAAAWRAHKDFNYTEAAWAEIVDATFCGLAERPPSQTFFPDLYLRFAQPQAWRIFDDVLPALQALRSGGVKLGIISNWDERLGPLLRALRLRAYFDAVVISSEAAWAKPSHRIFHQAARELGLSAANILHVGDDWDRDLRGAQSA